MNRLEECVLELRTRKQAAPHSEAEQERIEKECRETGSYLVGGEEELSCTPVRISLCGPPDAFTRRGCLHRHHYFEMAYVYRGHLADVMDGQRLLLNEGDILLLSPNVPHALSVEREDDLAFLVRIGNDLFEKHIIPMLSDNQMFMRFFVDYLYRGSQNERYLYFDHSSEQVLLLMENVIREYTAEEKQYKGIVQSSLIMLFCYLAREYEDLRNLPVGKTSSSVLIYEIITYISQHSADVTLDSLSQQFQYSPGYLSRLIRKLTGKSFSEILHYHKFNLATHYLETTALPIAEIAHLVGFTDAMHFNKAFKLRFGKTPTEYRKACQNRKRTAVE